MKDRGSASVEAAIVFPALLTIALLLFAGMQVMRANSQIQAAARSGARAAATAGSSSDARARAKQAVTSALSTGSACTSTPSVAVKGEYQPGTSITVDVSCQSKNVFSSVLGSKKVTGSATEFVSGILGDGKKK